MIHRVMLIASLVGLFASVYLLITYHFRTTHHVRRERGCEIVRASNGRIRLGFRGQRSAHILSRSFSPRDTRVCATCSSAHVAACDAHRRNGRFHRIPHFLTLVRGSISGQRWCLISAAAATSSFHLVIIRRPRALADKEK